uniref:Uncharacterized protein n=1 Tax=Fagus sylvatica TaxID=28930 RepID=A0A2N9HF06_FAGSY
MADLVNLKTKNPDLVLVFLPSPGRATPRQASPCLAKLRRASSLRPSSEIRARARGSLGPSFAVPPRFVLHQRFELVLAVLSAPPPSKATMSSAVRDVVRRNRIGRSDRPRQPPRRVQIWGSTERERELRMRGAENERAENAL